MNVNQLFGKTIEKLSDEEFLEEFEDEDFIDGNDFKNGTPSIQLNENEVILSFSDFWEDWGILKLCEPATAYCQGFSANNLTSDHWIVIITQSGEKYIISDEPVEYPSIEKCVNACNVKNAEKIKQLINKYKVTRILYHN